MPRPSMGSSARTKPVTLKLSQHEVNVLASRYGSAGKGLRRILDAEMHSLPLAEEPPKRPEGRCRIHPEWEVVEVSTHSGLTTTEKRCTTCGMSVKSTKPA